MTLMLKTLGSDETLDLWCLGVWLLTLTLWLNLTTDNELANLYENLSAFHQGMYSSSHSAPLSTARLPGETQAMLM
jgi:hypothetical protein